MVVVVVSLKAEAAFMAAADEKVNSLKGSVFHSKCPELQSHEPT
jgi:hypothetical protein